jgi:multicomponent Na+:H+ antiporter subunit G
MLAAVVLFLFLAGMFLNASAVLGILRLPDLYCRLHASSKNTTLGSLLVMAGLALEALAGGSPPAALKIALVATFVLATTPVASHALARAAYRRGTPLWPGTVVDQYAGPAPRGPAQGGREQGKEASDVRRD